MTTTTAPPPAAHVSPEEPAQGPRRELGPVQRRLAGLLALAVLGAVGWAGSAWVLGSFEQRYEITVVLGQLGQGITSGSDVKMRGVLVGEVGSMTLDEQNNAVATIALNEGYEVPERSTYAVTGKTLLGEKQVEVRFDGPFETGPFLPDGAIVADPGRVVEVTDLVAEVADLLAAIDPDDLATVVDDGLGAFDGQGPAIARAVDQGARVTDVFARSLDDQRASLHDLSLVAERLGTEGGQVNRLAQAAVDGFPTVSDNQAEIHRLLVDLSEFSRTLDATFTVNRPDIDRMIVEGDNVTRLLFDYREQVGQVVTGLVQYTENFGRGFRTPGIKGQAGGFQVFLDNAAFEPLCEGLPPELSGGLPICQDEPPSLPIELVLPEVPERLPVDSVTRRGLAEGPSE